MDEKRTILHQKEKKKEEKNQNLARGRRKTIEGERRGGKNCRERHRVSEMQTLLLFFFSFFLHVLFFFFRVLFSFFLPASSASFLLLLRLPLYRFLPCSSSEELRLNPVTRVRDSSVRRSASRAPPLKYTAKEEKGQTEGASMPPSFPRALSAPIGTQQAHPLKRYATSLSTR